jgi:5-methylcytosine-specific restriction endonuclease McrA
VKTPDAATEKRIRTLWRSKNTVKPFEAFYKWYMQQDQKCCYCGITEQEIEHLFEITKRATGEPLTKSKRGRHLELERKSPNKGYDDFKNLALACHWCNNAKTDTFTEEEFKLVGRAISKICARRKGPGTIFRGPTRGWWGVGCPMK